MILYIDGKEIGECNDNINAEPVICRKSEYKPKSYECTISFSCSSRGLGYSMEIIEAMRRARWAEAYVIRRD